MSTVQDELIEQLEKLPNVSTALWKESTLLCVYFNKKEVAHFQSKSSSEIDIRLTPAIIKREGLSPPEDTTSHLDRSKNSRWIIQSFKSSEDVKKIVRLVELATAL